MENFDLKKYLAENKLLKEGIENEVDGLRDFLRFKNVLDTHTVPKHADDEDQRRWQAATEELDDVLTNWLDLLAELDRVYPT
tara:strand:- start:2914 stop:3159 length:246 start_codon:yes stop_codon:yes gene_type:complete